MRRDVNMGFLSWLKRKLRLKKVVVEPPKPPIKFDFAKLDEKMMEMDKGIAEARSRLTKLGKELDEYRRRRVVERRLKIAKRKPKPTPSSKFFKPKPSLERKIWKPDEKPD